MVHSVVTLSLIWLTMVLFPGMVYHALLARETERYEMLRVIVAGQHILTTLKHRTVVIHIV